MQQYSNLRDPRHPRPRFRRIEVNMPLQPCHQQRWRAPRRSTSNISSQDARNREPASRHHTKVGDLLLQAPLQAKPARVLPQYDERSHSTSLDSQPIHGGADATGQSAIANDATALTHRRRNPGETLHGGPTLPEPAIPPVAVGHEREPKSLSAWSMTDYLPAAASLMIWLTSFPAAASLMIWLMLGTCMAAVRAAEGGCWPTSAKASHIS